MAIKNFDSGPIFQKIEFFYTRSHIDQERRKTGARTQEHDTYDSNIG